MNILVMIDIFGAVVTGLSLFFDVKNRPKISLISFVLLVFFLSFSLALLVNYLDDAKAGEESSSKPNVYTSTYENQSSGEDESIEIDIPVEMSTNDQTNEPANESASTESTEPVSVQFDVPASKKTEAPTNTTAKTSAEPKIKASTSTQTKAPQNTTGDTKILKIEPIIDCPYTINPITPQVVEIPDVDIEKRYGVVGSDNEYTEYEFLPQFSGTYRFEFSDVIDGTDLKMSILNSNLEAVESNVNLDNGDGLTVSMDENELYYLRVQQYSGNGSYTLNIGPQKDTQDISGATVVSDSIQFTDQENKYSFRAECSGTYRFELSNVQDGTDLKMSILNSDLETIESGVNLDNGGGLTVSMDEDGLYYLCVQQYSGIGAYTVNVGHQKDMQDISDATAVFDDIEFTDQINKYSFHAGRDGTYRFELSDVQDGTDFKMSVLNSNLETMESKVNLDNGDGLTVSMDEDGLYYLYVQQYSKVGAYTLNIGNKKPTVDISSASAVSDSIQYTDQENEYLFSPTSDGNYRVEFSNVQSGNAFRLDIYNSDRNNIKSGRDFDSKDGVTVQLCSGEKYYIKVGYYKGRGDYQLNIRKND